MVTSLKLLFIIAMTSPAADPLILEDYVNCSFTFGRIYTDQIAPLRFDVDLVIIPERGMLSGKTDIVINVKKFTKYITLHAHNLKIDMMCTMIIKFGKKPNCKENTGNKILGVVYCPENGIANLTFSDFISPGQYVLHIEHSSFLDENENKIIYPYSWTGNETRWIITNLYSSNAIRRLFPNWDESTIKEYLHVSMKYDTLYKVFMNMPIWYSYDVRHTRKTFYTEMHQTSTHFITFMIVPDLITNTKQYDINYFWHEKNATVALEHAHIVAYHVTLYFNWLMNITMSEILKKIDHIVLPICPMKSAGRPGLISYREKDVTFKKELDSPGQRINIAKLVSYEMTRQLFIGIINSHLNIEDKWLEELLASFYSFYVLEKAWLEEEMMELFVVQNLQTALDSDIYLELKPIVHKTKNDYGIDGLLYPLLYHKKAFALIRMMLYLFTPQKFDEIIKKYVQSRNANFWTIIEQVHPERYNNRYTIKEIMDSWLTKIHHPEMQCTRDYVEHTAMCNIISNNVSNFKIPFTYITGVGLQFYENDNIRFLWHETNETSTVIGIDPFNFFLINMEQIGYYRVNYDSKNWILLATHLQVATFRRIPVLNRAQIVNDAFYFTTVKKLEAQNFYKVIKFLNNETSYIVWHPMFNILSYMSDFLMTTLSESTKTNFVNILDELLRNVGYEERETDKEMTMPLRLLAIKWACKFGHSECINATTEKLIAYIHNDEPNIISRWTNWMYCTGMMGINMTVWEQMWQEGFKDKDMKILEHLTCTEDENIILHYLNLIYSNITVSTKLPMGKIYRLIIKRHIGKQKVMDYFLNHYFHILDRFPKDFGYLTLIGNIIMNVHCRLLLDRVTSYMIRNSFNALGYELWINIQNMVEVRRNQLINLQRKFEMF